MNILNTTDLCTLNGRVIWCVNCMVFHNEDAEEGERGGGGGGRGKMGERREL